MPKIAPFTCPCCGFKIPLKELFIFRKDHVTRCGSCSALLEPVSGKSFHWGFAFGFLGFVIPAEVMKVLYHSSLLAFCCGLVGSIIAVSLVALYLWKTTIFRQKRNNNRVTFYHLYQSFLCFLKYLNYFQRHIIYISMS